MRAYIADQPPVCAVRSLLSFRRPVAEKEDQPAGHPEKENEEQEKLHHAVPGEEKPDLFLEERKLPGISYNFV